MRVPTDIISNSRTYVSTAAAKFAPGNFVTEGTSDKVGVTLAIEDSIEANPLVMVRWLRDLSVEWLRSESLYIAIEEDDGLDSEGYPIGSPREWSDEELKELRRRERACDDYGSN